MQFGRSTEAFLKEYYQIDQKFNFGILRQAIHVDIVHNFNLINLKICNFYLFVYKKIYYNFFFFKLD